MRELHVAMDQVRNHVLAGGCKDYTEYAASLAKLRAYQSMENFLVDLNGRISSDGED